MLELLELMFWNSSLAVSFLTIIHSPARKPKKRNIRRLATSRYSSRHLIHSVMIFNNFIFIRSNNYLFVLVKYFNTPRVSWRTTPCPHVSKKRQNAGFEIISFIYGLTAHMSWYELGYSLYNIWLNYES